MQIAHDMKIFKLGDIYIDGTKIKANASKHKALSWKYACELEAQLKKEVETMLIVAEHVSQKSNDKQEVEPALDELAKLPEVLGKVERAGLDTGYFSAENVDKLNEQNIEPFIASGRQSHNQRLEERLADDPEAPENPSLVEAMQHRMKTKQGKEFYAKRKSTVEPVFGIIKEAMGFRHFMLRGIEAVKGEWTLMCLAYNLKRLCVLNS